MQIHRSFIVSLQYIDKIEITTSHRQQNDSRRRYLARCVLKRIGYCIYAGKIGENSSVLL
ncbi:MAG: hypothetical protein H6629_22275 [Calditrichae bacterium]|nr:hypothetical protein [Calditrichia bacterium]